jgi:predicted HNH restriction endonuclease
MINVIKVESLTGIPEAFREELRTALQDCSITERLLVCLFFMSELPDKMHTHELIQRNFDQIHPDSVELPKNAIRTRFNGEPFDVKNGKLQEEDRLWESPASPFWKNTEKGNREAEHILRHREIYIQVHRKPDRGEELGPKAQSLNEGYPKITGSQEDGIGAPTAARASTPADRGDAIAKNQSTVMEKTFIEGEKRAATTTSRNATLRVAAKKKWGLKCYCCGFDFEQFYGAKAKGVAIVHHLELFPTGKSQKRNASIDDVRVVCANCHFVIHVENPPIEVDELRDLISKSWSLWSDRGVARK